MSVCVSVSMFVCVFVCVCGYQWVSVCAACVYGQRNTIECVHRVNL